LQQQKGTSASIPGAQVPQSTSANVLQPTVAETQAKRKALTDAEAQQKRQKFMLVSTSVPTSASQPVDVAEQVNPLVQNLPSAIIPQGPTTDEVTEISHRQALPILHTAPSKLLLPAKHRKSP
jgi:hypothetical protein